MKKAFVAANIPTECYRSLVSEFELYPVPRDTDVASPVSFHPDMNIALIGRNAVIAPSYKGNYPGIGAVLEKNGYMVSYAMGPRSEKYPNDSSLNVGVGKDYVICRYKSADRVLLKTAETLGFEIIDVNQGYAACSSIICPDGVITSDKGIEKALAKKNIETLYVDSSSVCLPGYQMGFIGGAGGYSDGKIYFYGSVTSLPDAGKIYDFAESKGYRIIELLDNEMFDYGGIKEF